MGCQASLIVDTNCPKKRTIKKLETQNSFSDGGRVGESEKSRTGYQGQRQIQTTQPRTIYVKSTSKPQPEVNNPQTPPKNTLPDPQPLSSHHNNPYHLQPSQHHLDTVRAQNLSQSSNSQQFSQRQVVRQQNKQKSMNVSRPAPIITQEQEQKKKPLNNISMNRGQASSERKIQVEDESHMHEQNYYNSHSASSNNLHSNNVSSNASSHSLSLPQFNSCRQLHLN